MFSTVLSATLQGLQVEFIDVEADLSNGLPMFHMVGYLSSEVKEAGERVRTAIRNSGLVLPAKKIVVNLSPADVRQNYLLYDNKLCSGAEAAEAKNDLAARLHSIGYEIAEGRGDYKES